MLIKLYTFIPMRSKGYFFSQFNFSLLYFAILSDKIKNINLQRRIALKHTTTLEDACHSFDEMTSSLRNHFHQINQKEPENIKLANEYYKWISLKTNLILNEKSFQIPFSALPNVIPLSSQPPKNMDYNIRIDKVYGSPKCHAGQI